MGFFYPTLAAKIHRCGRQGWGAQIFIDRQTAEML
jgi:hypothetical protein